MEKFLSHTGTVLPFDRSNVDTDAILPKQYLKSISKFGFGDWLFDDLRYLDPGDVRTDTKTRRPNPDFVLNNPLYTDASILIARENFGCGSSREHAVWALKGYGIKAVIAPSFADIFYNNCFKNGVLPVVLPSDVVDKLFKLTAQHDAIQLTVDLENCKVSYGTEHSWSFTVDESRRQNLLQGHDEISITLLQKGAIQGFEDQLKTTEKWLFSN
ncbi:MULTISPECIES: 3-isopropylmalate dehydratase small subunit [Alteromonadaceae]|uniref:3-isopropylmalate dehydratase small subunit n=1 Tax=Alteromonadaceae TaxID=72275 RepID=UPI001C09D19D|nr:MULTISPECIES: 3-isopropylmalate dehydratase small subunit [Aliiglaciecola]MBU2879026.1 3-isopropylmalate dehydratase small subunit [Aliiglaciecola lipolytica]MDO6710724.1 3-isopropylmalate dehydratase small subunit [Aliiglaciecola sp. 2_MG-2023]MDO6751868.1 3-isopropylmalate dehydratase small subunit [Aliiglaciecola sp. 1_MG-2023]